MVRSRDLVLFVLILFFLGIAISITLVKNNIVTTIVMTDSEVDLKDTENLDFLAFYADKETDRSAVIERLREKIATEQITIEAVPSVESTIKETENETMDIAKLYRCQETDDALVFSRTWPLENMSVITGEGARTVLQTIITETTNESVSTASSSTLPVVSKNEVKNTLLQLPLSPVFLPEPACVPSEIVGVTTEGSLIFNGDAILYRTSPSDNLIGYARDGFPIYGVYNGEVDECGGYEAINGYRYTTSTERPYLLGCFRAKIQSFIVQ